MKKSLKTLTSLLVIIILGVACSKNDPSGSLSDAANPSQNGGISTEDVKSAPEFTVSENDTVEVNGDSVTVFNEKGEVILKGKLSDVATTRTSVSDVLADNYAITVEECYAGPASELIGKLIKLPKYPMLNLASSLILMIENGTITIKEDALSTTTLLKATLIKEKPGKMLA
jgi:hypothetical protein